MVKVAPGQYLIGTEIRKIQIKGRGVLVRTGSGYMYMSEHLLHFAKSEGIQLALMLLKQRKPYSNVVLSLLQKHKKTEEAQRSFLERCPEGIEDQLNNLVNEVNKLEQKAKKKKKKSGLNSSLMK